MSTLDDLKSAISAVTVARKRYVEDERIQTNLWATVAERNAWRTAFEWRDGPEYAGPMPGEYHEGMHLIRENLR